MGLGGTNRCRILKVKGERREFTCCISSQHERESTFEQARPRPYIHAEQAVHLRGRSKNIKSECKSSNIMDREQTKGMGNRGSDLSGNSKGLQ